MSVVKKVEHKAHLTDYLVMLRKRILLVLLVLGFTFTAVAVWTFRQEPMYQAIALLSIDRPEQPSVMGMGGQPSEEFYNSQFQMLRSRRIAGKLYNEMRMFDWERFKNAPAEEDPTATVQSWIRVTPIPRTHLVEVSIILGDPQLAAKMVNIVTNSYKDIAEENRQTAVTRAQTALKTRADEIQRSMDETTRKIQDFSRERQIFVTPEIRNVTLLHERYLEDSASQASITYIQAKSRRDALLKSIDDGSWSETTDSETLRDLRMQMYSIERAQAMEDKSYSERWKRSDANSRSLEVAKEEANRQIALERDRIKRFQLTIVAQDLATAEMNNDELTTKVKGNQEVLATISQDLFHLETLQKQQMTMDEIHKALLQAIETVKTALQYEETRVQIINQADVPKQKYSPRPDVNLPVSAAVGLVLGLGAAFFLEYLNTTIRMPRDIEDGLGLPVLGFVPAMSPKLKDFATRALITHLDPTSGPAEAFRGIRTEIMLRSDLRQVRTGLVTSTSPQEGKSTVAVNWAVALAQAGNKVLLIDADLRKPTLHTAFNMANDRGLSTLLAEKESGTVYIRKTDIENLHVLPGGPVPENPAELLGSRKMRTLLAEAAERYDSIIIDASPVLGVADANILSTMVDCVVLVVQASKNRRALIQRARNQLASVNARVAGAILNNVRGARGDYYYYRQYYRPVAEMMEQEEKL